MIRMKFRARTFLLTIPSCRIKKETIIPRLQSLKTDYYSIVEHRTDDGFTHTHILLYRSVPLSAVCVTRLFPEAHYDVLDAHGFNGASLWHEGDYTYRKEDKTVIPDSVEEDGITPDCFARSKT